MYQVINNDIIINATSSLPYSSLFIFQNIELQSLSVKRMADVFFLTGEGHVGTSSHVSGMPLQTPLSATLIILEVCILWLLAFAVLSVGLFSLIYIGYLMAVYLTELSTNGNYAATQLFHESATEVLLQKST